MHNNFCTIILCDAWNCTNHLKIILERPPATWPGGLCETLSIKLVSGHFIKQYEVHGFLKVSESVDCCYFTAWSEDC